MLGTAPGGEADTTPSPKEVPAGHLCFSQCRELGGGVRL